MAKKWTVIYQDMGIWIYGGDHDDYGGAQEEERTRKEKGQTPLIHDYYMIRKIGVPDND